MTFIAVKTTKCPKNSFIVKDIHVANFWIFILTRNYENWSGGAENCQDNSTSIGVHDKSHRMSISAINNEFYPWDDAEDVLF